MNLYRGIVYALRQFRHSAVFTTAAVLTLALGIGGTTSIFSLIHSVMLRSLPVADPSRLYRIGEGDDCCVEGSPQDRWGMYSYDFYRLLKQNTPEFDQLAAFQAGGARMGVRRQGAGSAAKPLRTEYVTGNYFSTLGVAAFAGRLFSESDDQPAAAPVAVLSHHAWQVTYGGEPSVLGSTLMIEGRPFTAIGIAPAGFFGDTLRGNPTEVWIPLQQEPVFAADSSHLRERHSAWLRVIGRLKPGASIQGTAPRLTAILRQWIEHDADYPASWMPDILRDLPKQNINVVPAGSGVGEMKEELGRSLEVLLAVCGVVLLIACANVANLLLARAASRRGQTAIRLAIGATGQKVIAQALTESVLLSAAGGVAGLVVAMGASKLLLSLVFNWAQFVPISTMPSLPALGFAFLLALGSGVVFGAAPAWFAARTDPAEALRGTGRSTRDHSSWARKALLIAQAALSVVLVAGATMLARSLGKLEQQDFGYPEDGRVEVQINAPPLTYSQERLAALNRALQTRLEQLPGIEGAGLALYNPLTDNWAESIIVEGHPQNHNGDESGSSWVRLSSNYLQLLGQPLLRGRYFTEADNETAPNVAIVNEGFVKRFFRNGEDPLDHHFGMNLPENAGSLRIVGVVHDARWAGWGFRRPPLPMFYVPLAQTIHYQAGTGSAVESMRRLEGRSHFIGGFLLKTSLPPGQLEPLLTRAVAEVDPNLTIISVRSLKEQVDLMFDEERAEASLAGLFGAVALLLAAIGLYGVTAYSVAERTGEIGVRMALGADRGRVMSMVVRGAFTRVVAGLLLGIPLAIAAGKGIASQLYGVRSWDPAALAIAALSLTACALVASLIPALRAAAISPMDALRSE
ncbi:MAG: ABC transporter permease [Acidobacteria bacterium]|nr:ABC transporter permease [Acidobacteriota bacterium]